MIVRANQWTGFYMIETSTMKELNVVRRLTSNTEESESIHSIKRSGT